MPSTSESLSETVVTTTQTKASRVGGSTICAKLYTVVEGRKDGERSLREFADRELICFRHLVLLLSIDCPLIIGRNPAAWYASYASHPIGILTSNTTAHM